MPALTDRPHEAASRQAAVVTTEELSVTSRCCKDDLLLLRTPLAWPHHPIMTLARDEEDFELIKGRRVRTTNTMLGVIVDLPSAVRWRVYYVEGDQVEWLLTHPDPVGYLDKTYLWVDYRTLLHLANDGWRVD